ncbi:MAG TPA: hypothetical protein VIA64_07205 [Burkholderiales bacterium]|jgi:hypothetical protein
MQPGRRLRTALLLAALAGTLVAVYWASRLPSGPAADDLVASANEPRGGKQRSPIANPAPAGGALDLNRLQRPKTAEPTDDLFGARDFTPKRKPVQRAIAQPAVELAAAPAIAAAPPPPPPPFTYLGRLAEGGRTTVFLAQGDRNLVVQVGDVIDNTYQVNEIGPTLLVLTYLPQNLKQTMSIGAPQ